MSRLGLAVIAEGDRTAAAETVWEGAVPGERFGASIATTSGGDVVVGVPRAGVGRAKQEERFFGALMVFRRRKFDSGMWDRLGCSTTPTPLFGVFYFFGVVLSFLISFCFLIPLCIGYYVLKYVWLYFWA